MEKFILFCAVTIFFSTVLILFFMKKWIKYYLLEGLNSFMRKEASDTELQKTVMAQSEKISELKEEINEKNNQISSLIGHINAFPMNLAGDSKN